jgi:hypothetical protein
VITSEVATFGEDGIKISTILGELTSINISIFAGDIPDQEALAEHWLELASSDEHVKTVFEYVADELNWQNFSNILDTVEGSFGGKRNLNKLKAKNWVDKKLIDRFTGTANNRRTAGSKSRHGLFNQKPYSDPITFEEAYNLVRTVLGEWLGEKN